MKQGFSLITVVASLLIALHMTSCNPTEEKAPAVASIFSPEQENRITAADSTTPMRVFKITKESDSLLLRTPSEDVVFTENDFVLKLLVDRMYATVRDSLSLGAGIAAPQVGILKNIVWVQRFDKDNFPFEVFINPKIIQYSKKKQDCRKGCLSIPGRSDTLNTRAYAMLLKYQNLKGKDTMEMMEDFTAVIVQHEVDHLNGILYLDHLKQEVKDAQKLKTRDL
ncbi:MAG: peptide deformylase [Leeuwenhoekiella sp.]